MKNKNVGQVLPDNRKYLIANNGCVVSAEQKLLRTSALFNISPSSVPTGHLPPHGEAANFNAPSTWRERAECASTGVRGENCSGFTLIELLVVVLIIGILTAVALPQYQKAVWKSRMVQMLAIGRAFLTAQQAYFLEYGSYAKELTALPIDLNIPARFYAHCNTEDGHITIQDNKVGLIWDFYPATGQRTAMGICAVYNTSSQASVLKAACQNITQDHSPANWTTSNQTAYHLYL